MAKLKLKQSVDVKSIWVTIQCLECGHRYDVQMKGGQTRKTCRCTRATIDFHISAEPGAVVVTAISTNNSMAQTEIKISNIYIEEN